MNESVERGGRRRVLEQELMLFCTSCTGIVGAELRVLSHDYSRHAAAERE